MIRVPCAIYTRKSSDEGLEKEFNSLDAQREACEAYITSQKHAGWLSVRDLYDDGGLSGGTMERPGLRRLLADIKAGKVQTVVVYKVDRLTRSLADFSKIVDVLDAHGASFVSVTQQFNTTTSMGRLTLNMLLSFAQFEREIAGERIRDKIAASKAKGMWMGGGIVSKLRTPMNGRRSGAGEVEALVRDRLRSFLACRSEVSTALETQNVSAHDLGTALKRSSACAAHWSDMTPRDMAEFIRAMVQRVTVEVSQISLKIDPVRLAEKLNLGARHDRSLDPIVLTIPSELKRCGKGKRIMIHNGVRDEIRPGLIRLLREAFAAREALLANSDESLNAIEARRGASKGRMTSLMRISYLSPQIIQDIMIGRQPLDFGAKRLLGLSKDLPHDWLARRAHLGFDRG